jgi:hypothetical protein
MERNRPVPPTLTVPDFVTVFYQGPFQTVTAGFHQLHVYYYLRAIIRFLNIEGNNNTNKLIN